MFKCDIDFSLSIQCIKYMCVCVCVRLLLVNPPHARVSAIRLN